MKTSFLEGPVGTWFESGTMTEEILDTEALNCTLGSSFIYTEINTVANYYRQKVVV